MCKSVWFEETSMTEYPKLNGKVKTSVLVIGGGISGLLTAFLLKKNGIDCIVVEAKKICMGITRNTTAKITSQHGLIYSKLFKTIGKERTKKYFSSNEQAISKFKEMCKNIECDFKEVPSYVYSLKSRSKIEEEIDAVNKVGGTAEFVSDIELPIKILGAIKFEKQAQFNPLKFLSHISKNLNIYENTMVTNIEGNVAYTDSGEVHADKFVIATHFPFINKHGFYFLKMYQQRSYVLALENAQKLSGMYRDEAENGLSFREYDNLLLLGGAGHRTGKTGGGYSELRSMARNLYPDSQEKFCWATQDCITLDGVPYIGKYSANLSNVFVATGFNKWGMTSSMVSSQILCDMIMEKQNEYEDLYSPQRWSINKELFSHVAETAKNFLTPTTKRCSHLGCALKFNEKENSWDCPCHGSRFGSEGDLIDNPALKGIEF